MTKNDKKHENYQNLQKNVGKMVNMMKNGKKMTKMTKHAKNDQK